MTRPGSVMMVRPSCLVSRRSLRKASMLRGPCRAASGAIGFSACAFVGGGGSGVVTVGGP
jgi:hypothetical protein